MRRNSQQRLSAILRTLAALVALLSAAPQVKAQLPPLIARALLLGNPEKRAPQISPDGKRLAWLAPDKHNVMQVWIRTIGKPNDRIVTADPRRGIMFYAWAWDSRTILYGQDFDGDENYHLFGADLESGNVRDLTPWQGVKSEFIATNPKFPEQVLVAMNVRDRKLMDVWRINIRSGAAELDTRNPGDVAAWTADDGLAVRAAIATMPDGGAEVRLRDHARSAWHSRLRAGPEETISLIDFSRDGKSLYLASSIGADAARVVEREIASGREKVIAASDAADVEDVFVHPTRHIVQAAAFELARKKWIVTDDSVRDDFAAIGKIAGGDFTVVSRDLADKTWIVSFYGDRNPERYYLWDRARKRSTFLFGSRPKLEGVALAAAEPVDFVARDGMRLHAYLTLPQGVADRNLPMVLAVHGGPWSRDLWEYNGLVQLFANRGYAVLQVNFRGSSGFGKKYLHAGDRQWGLKMHDDLVDGVNWAVARRIADPRRVAIFGGSYGGYGALAGAAFTPEVFRCAADLCGPSSILTLFASMPPYWGPVRRIFIDRVGDPEKDKDLLRKVSPLFSADRIRIPLLIGQGANDVRVTRAEAEQIVAAIEKHRGRATYVLYSDEGHGLQRPENWLDFAARLEKFLADNLGGRIEPLPGDRMAGSTAVVKEIGNPPAPSGTVER